MRRRRPVPSRPEQPIVLNRPLGLRFGTWLATAGWVDIAGSELGWHFGSSLSLDSIYIMGTIGVVAGLLANGLAYINEAVER